MLAATSNFGLSYILEWVALVIVALVIWRYIAPPLRKRMDAKRAEISAQLNEGAEAKRAAEELLAERRQALTSAKTEADAIREQGRRGAETLLEDGRRRAAEEEARIVARAQVEIEATRSRVRAEVIAEVGSLVVAAAERLVNEELNDTEQHRLIDEAIDSTEREVEV